MLPHGIHFPGFRLRVTARRATVCLCGLLALCFWATTARAQYRFDHWTADNGLPQNSVQAILQTRDGYLWLATPNGLARFDGVRFTIFDRSNSPGIGSNRFNSLYEDRDGGLWAGTENSGVTRYYHGAFITYTTEHGLPDNYVRGITGDEAGNLWILAGHRVMRWAARACGCFLPVTPVDMTFYAAVGQARDVNVVQRNNRGGFWGIEKAGLHRFARGRLTTYTRQDGLPSLNIIYVAEDERGALWIATADAGVARIEDSKVVKVYTERDGLPGNATRITEQTEQTEQTETGQETFRLFRFFRLFRNPLRPSLSSYSGRPTNFSKAATFKHCSIRWTTTEEGPMKSILSRTRREFLAAMGAALGTRGALASADALTLDRPFAWSRHENQASQTEYLFAPGLTYLNTASLGPTPRDVLDRTVRVISRQHHVFPKKSFLLRGNDSASR